MRTNRISIIIGALMCAAAAGAFVARPDTKAADLGPPIALEAMVPKRFGDWREEPRQAVQIINPQTKALLDRIYSQLLNRTYVNDNGYRIMLSLAYGNDARDRASLQAHKPEVCYPAQGFAVHYNEAGILSTASGQIPVRRLFATMGTRNEPLTYWFTVGDTAVKSMLQKRLVDLRYGLTGRIPDGMLIRVSSIDRDTAQAFGIQNQFVDQLLEAVSPADRRRLAGLGES